MSAPDVPDGLLGAPGGFVADCRPGDLVYFVLNVGDGDAQLVLLPADDEGRRRALIVDVASARKMEGLLDALAASPLLPPVEEPLAVVVATHPHDDHIAGMAAILDRFAEQIREFWDPGYYHPTDGYLEMMAAVERHRLNHLQPASGTVRWIGQVKVTVIAPGVALRGRFDSYGVEINNSSIALKLDFPAQRVVERNEDRSYVRLPSMQTLILSADAQTLSWAQVAVDFPQLGPDNTAASKALRLARGTEPLSAQVFKVPHHGSKHGLTLELVEEISPALSIVSSGRERGKYGFPHAVTQDAMREALQPIASKPKKRKDDHELGIHYTGSRTSAGDPAGSIAVVISPGGKRRLWRFMEDRHAAIDLAAARPFA
jgi:beta-lactamase superfamily II metal-dependent hydrolase